MLGITWLRPFPSDDVAEALEGRSAVAVMERLDRIEQRLNKIESRE